MAINTTALLIMDVQPPIAELGGPTLLERLADGASAARGAGVAVIYVKVGFRPGYPEIGPRANAILTRIKEVGAFVDGASAEATKRSRRGPARLSSRGRA
jgi:nicotinamidase-related amidase